MVHYNDELIEDIKNSNDIVDIISQYVILKRSGRNFFGVCPLHGRTAGQSSPLSPRRLTVPWPQNKDVGNRTPDCHSSRGWAACRSCPYR